MRGCNSTLLNFLVCSGSPRYFPRNLLIFIGKFCRSGCTIVGSSHIGKISILAMLTNNPEHWPKVWRILCRFIKSVAVGAKKIATSSAYSKHLRFADHGRTGWRNPIWAARSIMRCRESIARINKIGDSGSPCCSPHACLIISPGLPFRRILEDDVRRREEIQSLHFWLNPVLRVLQVGMASWWSQKLLKYQA